MKKYFKIQLLLLFVISFFASSCEKVKEDMPVFKEKKKTVLIYMAANNNLSSNAVNNFSDLLQADIPDNSNLLVYMHLPNKTPALLQVFNAGEGAKVDTLYKFNINTISASVGNITSVMNIVKTICPAEKYGLMLWSHGTGWLPKGFYSKPQGYSIARRAYMISDEVDPYAHMVKSFGSELDPKDAESGNYCEVELVDLQKAIPYNLEFLIFDACLMGEIEVIYEFKDKVEYFIGSPAEVLSSGFPYSRIVKYFFEDVVNAKAIAEEYYNSYNEKSGTSKSATIGAFKTEGLERVAEAAKIIFDKNRDKILSLDKDLIQRYYRGSKRWFYDLEDFLKILTDGDADYSNFKKALDDVTLYKNATDYFLDIKIERTSGIGSFIPDGNSVLSNAYKQLAWNRDSQMIN